MSALTFEQQKEMVRRMEEGHRYAQTQREAEASSMSPSERWTAIEAVQGFTELFPAPQQPAFIVEEHGLVLQQQRFLKLRRA